MPTISPAHFLKIVDRIAAQYEIFKTAATTAATVENRASLQVGTPYKARKIFPGTNVTALVLMAREAGSEGNDITIDLLDPGTADAELDVRVFGKQIVVSLATDGSSQITTTSAELKDALEGTKEVNELIEIIVPGPISGVVDADSGQLAEGSGDEVFTVQARYVGSEGNDITLTLEDPGAINSSLSVETDGNDIVVSLATVLKVLKL